MRSRQFHQGIPRVVVAALLPLLLCLTPPSGADTLPESASQPLTIQACRQIALANQPTLAASRASLQAALDRQQALECLRVPTCLAKDLPIRRKQSALGVMIAQAGIAQAEAETLHGVSVGYLGAWYADQQVRLTKVGHQSIRQRIDDLKNLVEDPMVGKRGKIRRGVVLEEHGDLIQSFLDTLDGRLQEAEQGKLRALAALREAMGVAPDFPIVVPQRDLPCPRPALPPLAELIALAQARRGEAIQAAAFAEVVCLEIDAQASSKRPTLRTFASGSDIHAKPVPTGDMGGVNFRPSIVGPEMPANLTGSRSARMQQARDYHERAQANAVKARNLIALEVEDLYRRWLEKTKKADRLGKAFKEAEAFSNKVKDQYRRVERDQYPHLDEVINAGLMTTRLQLEWKEAHFQELLALAALERATVGGLAVDLDAAPACESEGKELGNHVEQK